MRERQQEPEPQVQPEPREPQVPQGRPELRERQGRRALRDGWEPAAASSGSCAEPWGAREQRGEPELRERQEHPEQRDEPEQQVPAALWLRDAEQKEAQEHQGLRDAGAWEPWERPA